MPRRNAHSYTYVTCTYSCPDPTILSPFKYNSIRGVAEADLFSMFKFPDSNRVHFQCDIVVCQGPCQQPECDETLPEAPRRQSSFRDPRIDPTAVATEGVDSRGAAGNEEGALMASYSVFVLEPGEKIGRVFFSANQGVSILNLGFFSMRLLKALLTLVKLTKFLFSL